MRKVKVALFVILSLPIGAVVGALVGLLVGLALADADDRHGVMVLVCSFAGAGIGAVAFGAIGLWLGLRSTGRE